jgi:hypothetical protein
VYTYFGTPVYMYVCMYVCIYICSTSWWWANKCLKHVEAINLNKLKVKSATCLSYYTDRVGCCDKWLAYGSDLLLFLGLDFTVTPKVFLEVIFEKTVRNIYSGFWNAVARYDRIRLFQLAWNWHTDGSST